MDKESKIYAFGGGLYGQLGLGFEIEKCWVPTEIEEINERGDKVRIFGCGSNISFVVTELGLMYVWGMFLDDQFDCMYFPTMFMLPDDVVFTQI